MNTPKTTYIVDLKRRDRTNPNYIFVLCILSLLLSSCAAWTKATASSQWISIEKDQADPALILMS